MWALGHHLGWVCVAWDEVICLENKMAVAYVRGGEAYAGIRGTVRFFTRCGGTLVVADIAGLPDTDTGFFAFHIHEGGDCRGSGFPDTGAHYNPTAAEHPRHSGDLPPLLSDRGRAYCQVLTGRFRVDDVIGKTVVIHSDPDDFKTQPSGNAGEKIACGVIRRV